MIPPPDPEHEVRQVCCPADEYLEIRDYLVRHGASITYLTTELDEEFPEDGGIVTFLVARPPKLRR